MATKLSAAKIANDAGADMVIANGADIYNISHVVSGEPIGTLFKAHKDPNFKLLDYIGVEDRKE